MNDNTGLIKILLKDANIPRRYAGNALDVCRAHDGWSLAFNQLFSTMSSLTAGHVTILCGARGTGKTQMACELIRHTAASLSYFSRYDVLQDYLDSVGRNFDAEDHDVRYLAPRLVVLDEIAKSGESAWVESRLFHLVNKRYNDLKHTVLITAAQPADIETIVGPSVADRINEGGTVIHLNWPSFRSNKT